MIATTLLVALAVGSPAAPEGVSLRIDDSALLSHERATVVEHTTLFVREDATKALGQSPDDDPQAAAILVSLSWVSLRGLDLRRGRPHAAPGEAPRLVERFECECINSGLAKAIVERLPTALEQLEPPPTTTPWPAVLDLVGNTGGLGLHVDAAFVWVIPRRPSADPLGTTRSR
jgi:hypothetical protein